MKTTQLAKTNQAGIVKVKPAEVDIWLNEAWVKRYYAPKLDNQEFALFKAISRRLGACPVRREIWAVKFQGHPAIFPIARDYYRRIAQEQPDYDGHTVDTVCEKDDFAIEDGTVHHKYSPHKERGVLMGAISILYRKGIGRPFYVYCSFREFDKATTGTGKKNTWNTHPELMMKKVPEAHVLKMGYQGLYSGVICEDDPVCIDGAAIDIKAEQIAPPPTEVPTELEKEIEIFLTRLDKSMEGEAGLSSFDKAKIFFDNTFRGHPDYKEGNITFIDNQEKLDSAIAALSVAQIEAEELSTKGVDGGQDG